MGQIHRIRDGIYVFNFEDHLMVKQLQHLPKGRIRVVSANPDYEPYVMDPSDESLHFRLVGQVIWSGRRL